MSLTQRVVSSLRQKMFTSSLKLLFTHSRYCYLLYFFQSSTQARRQRGGRGGHCPRFSFLPPPPPRFISCPPPPPPIYFLPPHGIFLGGKSCCFWPEKTLKFVISTRKSLRISAKTFFFLFLGDHLLLAGKNVKICDFGQKKPSDFGEDLFFLSEIFTETSPQSNSGTIKIWNKFNAGFQLCFTDFNFAPPELAKLATPLVLRIYFCVPKKIKLLHRSPKVWAECSNAEKLFFEYLEKTCSIFNANYNNFYTEEKHKRRSGKD